MKKGTFPLAKSHTSFDSPQYVDDEFITKYSTLRYTAMYAAQVAIPDTPVDVVIQLKRGKALISRIINRSPDEDYNSAQEITEELRSEGFLKGKNKLYF